MKLLEMDTTQPPMPLPRQPGSRRVFSLAMACDRLRAGWRFLAGRVGIDRKRGMLAVRETVALGDRRFVLVIQAGSQRFLVGSSPSSVTLLSQLPDQFSGVDLTREHLTSGAGDNTECE